MRRPGTDERNVQMSDVLCDFCERPWTEDVEMIEGHRGSCICGRCLAVAHEEVIIGGAGSAPAEFICPMCLESTPDRAALDRGEESGWQSPVRPEAVICRRCIKLASGALGREKRKEKRQ